MRSAIAGIGQAQSALRQTQVEQGDTLRGIAEAIGVLVRGQAALTETVSRQGESLTALTETVGRHGEALASLATGQAEILRRLPDEG